MPPGQSPRSSVEAVAPVLSDYECHDFTQTVAAEIGSAVSCIIDFLPSHLAIADGTCCILGHTEACFEIQLRCLPDEGTIRRHPAVSATWPRPPEARDSPSASRVRPTATEPPAFFEAHVQGPCQHGQPSSVCTVCHPSINSVVYDSVHPAVLASPDLTPSSLPPRKRPRVSICDETPSSVDTPPAPAARPTDPPLADTIFSERRPAVAAALPAPAPFGLQPEARDPAPVFRREDSPGTQALYELLANPSLFPLDFCSEFEEVFSVAISSAACPSPIDHGGSPSSYHSGDSCEQDYGDSASSPDSQSSCSLNDSLPSSGPSSPAFA